MESPRLSVDLSFTEIEAWAEASGWDLEFRQLSAGRLRGRVRILTGAHCTAMRVDLNQAYHQVGQVLAERLAFGLPSRSCGEFNWCRSRAQGGDILNFNQEGGFDGTSGKSFSGCALSFERESLEELAEILDLRVDLDDISRCGGTLLKASEETERLRAQFDLAFQRASERGSTGLLEASSLLETGAAESILRLIARSSGEQPNTVQPARRSALRRALEVLEAPENFPITVAKLCALVGVSAPSLYRAFRDEFGVSPKQYIQSRVLSAVRSELVAATPGHQINDIANAWGIWHMGKFAADYRSMFGELPSETLRSH
jgi:AraC family ethanolamine operon transcriptional activator